MVRPYALCCEDDLDIFIYQGQNHDSLQLLFCVYKVTILKNF